MEHTAIRNAASLCDLCPMIKYRITGPDAADYLNHLTLRNAAKLPVGSVHYTVWCDDEGKVPDDGTLFRHGDDLSVEIYALRELQYVKPMLPVTVVERPFFNPPRKRATPPGRF